MTFLGIITRTTVYRGLHWNPLILGNYDLGFRRSGGWGAVFRVLGLGLSEWIQASGVFGKL